MTIELKSASSVKTGKKFLEKRKDLGVSIKEASEILYINKDYLQAIETGTYNIFPSESFAKAYFKKYEDFLKIKEEFPSVFDLKPRTNQPKISQEIIINKNRDVKKIFISLGLAISLIFAIYLFFALDSSDKNLNEESINDIENQPVNEIDYQNNAEIIELIEAEKLVAPIENANNILKLQFQGESWMEIYIENKISVAQLFNAGDSFEREILSSFKIVVGNADFVKGTYNGYEIDFIADANRLSGVSTIILNE